MKVGVSATVMSSVQIRPYYTPMAPNIKNKIMPSRNQDLACSFAALPAIRQLGNLPRASHPTSSTNPSPWRKGQTSDHSLLEIAGRSLYVASNEAKTYCRIAGNAAGAGGVDADDRDP
jgi:hypothetical protein